MTISRKEAAQSIAARELAAQKKRVQLMAFDPGNPPKQEDAKALLAEVAKLLGVDEPSDTDTLQKSLASLLEAAGGDVDTSASTEHVEDPAHHSSIPVLSRADVQRGHKILNGTAVRPPNRIDANAVRRGQQAFKS